MNKTIPQRLDVLQRIVNKSKPCKIAVTFSDDSTATTDPGGALDILRERGPLGEIESFQADQPVWRDWARMLTVVLHPAPNQRIEDFE